MNIHTVDADTARRRTTEETTMNTDMRCRAPRSIAGTPLSPLKRSTRLKAKWRNHMFVTVFGVAIAAAASGLVQPAVSHAKDEGWDIGSFDSCLKKVEDRYLSGQIDTATFNDEVIFCCNRSGGEWSSGQGCTAPPATAQKWPQPPLGELPPPAPAKDVPSAPQLPDVGQNPQPQPATQAPSAPQTSEVPPPNVRDHRQR